MQAHESRFCPTPSEGVCWDRGCAVSCPPGDMKPLFTVHAGEYLVGAHIEKKYRKWRVWIPSKDTGIDLLVTDSKNKKTVSLQVKFSKDFNPTGNKALHKKNRIYIGWWTHDMDKIKKSAADFWVFVLPSFTEQETNYVILPPSELYRRLRRIHGRSKKRVQSYLLITKKQQCWETRGLSQKDQALIVDYRYKSRIRDFSEFLNAWGPVEKKLKK